MSTFKDANDRDWIIRLDAPTILRVRSATCDQDNCKHMQRTGCTGLDLADMSGDTQRRLHRDVCLLVDTLYLLCEPAARDAHVSPEQFGAVLVGDAIARATVAMDEAIAFFFPASTRQILTAVTAKQAQVKELGRELALSKINNPKLVEDFMAKMEAQLDKELRLLTTPSNSATDLPES